MYTLHMWTLVALVVLPFLLGLLCGINIYSKKILIKRIQEMPPEKLQKFIDDYEKD